ncbi:DUF2851 family protein [Galbibacter pacificus]|uniref:DUF2851 family protein n=1 Tax=Galbibacter pacificus TaxID=2996052 RepID=A0ABT6FVP7_9FLAO|nr:DUF2851 family protein [Galbibacter pacificus]MDG3583743.1 DUF2851 family protein [Galbibacter pacificus]MDG3587339.1 DUF2851 family protein [Galbibacter pacificus]
MKEDFLHYIWKFKRLSPGKLVTETGESLQILLFGTHNKHTGSDFLNAKIKIAGQLWAGNVEPHIKSSHWYAHHHEKDAAYNNVILHVVWEHDVEVFNSGNGSIPTLALKGKIDSSTLAAYNNLLYRKKHFINCENQINTVDELFWERWLELLFFERLEQKAKLINAKLEHAKNDWEAVLFKMLCKNFGLKVNADAFLKIANAIPYTVIRKNSVYKEWLEALFYGKVLMLNENCTDAYFIKLKETYAYIKHKYKLAQALLNQNILV